MLLDPNPVRSDFKYFTDSDSTKCEKLIFFFCWNFCVTTASDLGSAYEQCVSHVDEWHGKLSFVN